jgi:benzoyl-CoA reductase/2-hydroxyglutaryl-CoA dehydratase subunit BcrC/BadD/HgdB
MARYGIGEILQALDVVPIYPENYGAATATMGANVPYLECSEADGFSNFICGYFRTGLGFARQMAEVGDIPPDAPFGGMAKPSVLVLNTRFRLCDVGYKSMQALGRYMDVPTYCLDMALPAVDADHEEMEKHYIWYMVEQFKDFVFFLEKILGRKMNPDRFEEIVDTSLKTRHTWYKCHQLRKAIPSPMPSPDVWACLTPEYYMPGERESLEFYQSLLEELKYRVANKIAAVPNEKYRILWGEPPPWYAMDLFDWMMKDLGVVPVIESHWYNPTPCDISPTITDPYERLAWMFYEHHILPTKKAKGQAEHWIAQRYLDWVKEYTCDGAVLMIVLSCAGVTIHHLHARNVLLDHARVPTLVFEADLADPRTWYNADVRMKVEGFVETMESYRKMRG